MVVLLVEHLLINYDSTNRLQCEMPETFKHARKRIHFDKMTVRLHCDGS